MADLTAVELMRLVRQLHDLHHTGRPPLMRLPHWLMDRLVAEAQKAWIEGNSAWPCPFGDPDTMFGIPVIRDNLRGDG